MKHELGVLAAAAAEVARELASLHQRGLVHGAVDASQVRLDAPDAGAMLTGLEHARPSGSAGGTAGAAAYPEHDVAGLGHLLLAALGVDEPFALLRLTLSAPDRTGWRRYLPAPAPRDPEAQLRDLARRAAAATPETSSPTAAEVADRLERIARLAIPTAGRLAALGATRMSALAGGIALAGAGGLLAFSLLRPTDHAATDPGPPRLPAPAAPTSAAPALDPPVRLWPPRPPDQTCPGPDPAGADVDGDGCPEAVEVEGGVVRAGTRRWAVGEAGDVVAVGDWDCDGRATPAVLRPSTGGLFVFDDWAPPDEERRARPLSTTPGAVDLEARGCGHALLHLAGGSSVVVATRAAPSPVESRPEPGAANGPG